MVSVKHGGPDAGGRGITPMRLRGKLVRFHLPDVLAELQGKAQTSKRGCTRKAPVLRA